MVTPSRHWKPGRAHCVARSGIVLCVLALFLAGIPVAAQPPDVAPDLEKPDYSRNPEWFPRIYKPYVPQRVPAPNLSSGASVTERIRDGKLEMSLAQLLDAVVENNLDLAVARYNNSFAETDILRAKAGQAPRGVAGARVPSGLFAGAIGAGLGGGGGDGGGGGGGSAISGRARQVFIGPRGAFDPVAGLNFSVGRTTSPLNTLRVAGVPTVVANTTALQAFYTQGFTTGTSFSISFNTQRQSSTQQFLLFNPSFVSGYSLSVNQQLMNGFGFGVTRRFMNVAQNGRRIAREWFRQQVIDTVAQAQSLYWDLAASRDRLRAAEQALSVAERLHENNKKQAEIGTLAPLDVLTAEAEVAARERDRIVAETDSQMREAALKNVFSKQIEPALRAARIEVTDSLPEPQDAGIPGLEEALSAAMRNRPEIRQAEGNILNQETAVQFTRNRLKPTLNIFARFATAGLTGGLGAVLRQVGRIDFPEYAVGFSLSFPLLNRSAQADDLRARLEQRQSETALQRTRNQIGLEVRNAVIGLMQTQAQVAAARKAVDRMEQTLDAEEKKLQAGVSIPYNVIQVQRDLLAAQLAAVEARAGYAKAVVQMDRATGVTLEKTGIDLEQVF
ncbi:MAG: TolC family protein [Acidobacteria bacterium]|nr:TolC family protein [Acidobacteriota bacterium]